MKRAVPLVITFLTGFFLVVSFFILHEPFGQLEQLVAIVWYTSTVLVAQAASDLPELTGLGVVEAGRVDEPGN